MGTSSESDDRNFHPAGHADAPENTSAHAGTVLWFRTAVLAVHLLVRRELGPLRERRRGTRAGLARPGLRAPLELATVRFGEALRRQLDLLRLRATGNLPAHFD